MLNLDIDATIDEAFRVFDTSHKKRMGFAAFRDWLDHTVVMRELMRLSFAIDGQNDSLEAAALKEYGKLIEQVTHSRACAL